MGNAFATNQEKSTSGKTTIAYKSKQSQLPRHRIASQVGVSHDLTKPVTLHYWPQVRKSSFAKPYDVNAPGPSRNSPKHVSFQSPRESVGSNDMIPIGQKFSPIKSSNVYLKTTPPRSGLTWKPTGRIFTQVGLKWIPIRKFVETCYNTNDSASPLGKETHNPKTVICENSSSLSAVKVILSPNTPARTSKFGKSVTAKESVEEPVFEIASDDVEQTFDDKIGDVSQPPLTDADETQEDATPRISKKDWFKKSLRPETLDPD
ncbi:hypothetical protein Tco_0717400 [Tanacetum coccineum]